MVKGVERLQEPRPFLLPLFTELPGRSIVPYLIEIMYVRRMVKQAIRLGLLVTLLILALSACGGAGGSAQEEEQAKEEEQANKVHHIPEDSQVWEGKPLPAGHYVTEEFKPTMSFDLDSGWTRGGTELRDAWDIRDLENDAFWLVFTTPEEVYLPNGSGGLKIVPAPEDMVGWLRENPYLKSEKPKPTSVGGEKGVQFDAIVSSVPEEPVCYGCSDLGLFHESAGATAGVDKGEKLRFILLKDVKGKTVTIMVESSALGFDEFLPKAQQVIETVEWKGT
jgi:hypothetical protein